MYYLLNANLQILDGVIDPENGVVVPVEDDDVRRERDLLHSKPITTLQMDNNLVIKYGKYI